MTLLPESQMMLGLGPLTAFHVMVAPSQRLLTIIARLTCFGLLKIEACSVS